MVTDDVGDGRSTVVRTREIGSRERAGLDGVSKSDATRLGASCTTVPVTNSPGRRARRIRSPLQYTNQSEAGSSCLQSIGQHMIVQGGGGCEIRLAQRSSSKLERRPRTQLAGPTFVISFARLLEDPPGTTASLECVSGRACSVLETCETPAGRPCARASSRTTQRRPSSPHHTTPPEAAPDPPALTTVDSAVGPELPLRLACIGGLRPTASSSYR